MRSLEIAKELLKDHDVTLGIVKDRKMLFKTGSPGVKGIIEAIETLKEELTGASAADKVVGKAAALLFAYSKVKEVYAVILSKEGLKTLEANSIRYEFEKIVPQILNKKQSDLCPFERLTLNLESPKEAYETLRKNVKSC